MIYSGNIYTSVSFLDDGVRIQGNFVSRSKLHLPHWNVSILSANCKWIHKGKLGVKWLFLQMHGGLVRCDWKLYLAHHDQQELIQIGSLLSNFTAFLRVLILSFKSAVLGSAKWGPQGYVYVFAHGSYFHGVSGPCKHCLHGMMISKGIEKLSSMYVPLSAEFMREILLEASCRINTLDLELREY